MNLTILKIIRYVGVGIGVIRMLLLYKQWIPEYIKFRDYLFTINDFETLRLLGAIYNGKKAFGSIPNYSIHRKIEGRYLETGDRHYYLFHEYMVKSFKIHTLTFIITFMFYIITAVVEELFIKT
jgi:hypothetical protein